MFIPNANLGGILLSRDPAFHYVHRPILLFMQKWNMIPTTLTGSSVLRDLRQCRHGLAGTGKLSSAKDTWEWGAAPDLLHVSAHSTQGSSAMLQNYGIQKEDFLCLSSFLPHPTLMGNKRGKIMILKRNSAIHNIRYQGMNSWVIPFCTGPKRIWCCGQ